MRVWDLRQNGVRDGLTVPCVHDHDVRTYTSTTSLLEADVSRYILCEHAFRATSVADRISSFLMVTQKQQHRVRSTGRRCSEYARKERSSMPQSSAVACVASAVCLSRVRARYTASATHRKCARPPRERDVLNVCVCV